jgi:hypothetical protein
MTMSEVATVQERLETRARILADTDTAEFIRRIPYLSGKFLVWSDAEKKCVEIDWSMFYVNGGPLESALKKAFYKSRLEQIIKEFMNHVDRIQELQTGYSEA